MGEVLKAVGAVRDLKQSIGSNGADRSDPGVSLAPPPDFSSIAQDPIAASIGAPQPQGFSLLSQAMPTQQADTAQAAPAPDAKPVDNPYVDDTPKELADDEPITVTGDRFQPKHESLLGKIADTLLILRGRQPVFRQRTDAANMREAMKNYSADPEAAARRVNLIDADAAQKLRESTQRMQNNELIQASNLGTLQDKGFDRLASLSGAIQSSKDPAANYQRMLPTLRAVAGQYKLDDTVQFPDQYDANTLGNIKKGGLTVYQQEALQNQDETNKRITDNADRNYKETVRYHNIQRELATGRLAVSQQNADRPRGKAANAPKNLFWEDGRTAGTLSADGRRAALVGPDGKWYAFRLRVPGDVSTRVRAPAEDAMLQAAMTPKGK